MKKINKIKAGKILIIVFLLFAAVITNGTNYYVKDEAHGGNDASDGLTPFTAWKTIDKVNAEMINNKFNPGDAILFERGSWFFGTIEIRCSGAAGSPIVFGAYGTGNKPVFIYAKQENVLTDWIPVAGRTNIWENSDLTFYVDVANLIFSPGPTFGKKLMNTSSASLSNQGDFWYDFDNNRILIYSVGNPASVYSNIQCVLSHNAIKFPDDDTHIVFENLAFKWYGRCVVEEKGSNCTYKNLDISYIGGADQFGDTEGRPYVARFGNGLQMWKGVHDVTITGCKIDNVYDAGITPQGLSDDAYDVYRLFIRNNIISNCEFSFEFFERGNLRFNIPSTYNDNINTHDIYFENNTCVNAGKGWSHNQRWGEINEDTSGPNPNGTHFRFEGLDGNSSNIFIRNNIFYGATEMLFWMIFPNDVVNNNNITIDYNCYYKTSDEYIGTFADAQAILVYKNFDSFQEWQAATNKESNSIEADPMFVSSAVFHLQNESPCIGRGTDGYIGAFSPPYFNGDKTLSTQTEVNEFNYPGVTGILTISGALIEDLTHLSCLKYTGGGLIIKDNAILPNLNGLQNLISVGKTEWVYEAPEGLCMEITGNAALTNLDGLINLNTVAGGLTIAGNGVLTNLNGLQNLNSLGCCCEPDGSRHGSMCRSLVISGNPLLTNLDGFQKITSCGGYVAIENNGSMTSLNGLQYLSSIGEFLTISGNTLLENIDGLHNLAFVGGHEFLGDGPGGNAPIVERRGLIISANTSLTNLDGFQNLNLVGGNLIISVNGSLKSIKGLQNLNNVQGGINIGNNDALTSLDGLQSLNSLLNHLDISGNASITSLNGLDNLISVGNEYIGPDPIKENLSGNLSVIDNSALLNLDGLNNLISIGGILQISGNASLRNLNGLESLASVGNNSFLSCDLNVYLNPVLNHFCGLFNLLDSEGLIGEFNVHANAFEITDSEIISGGPCGTTIYYGDLILSSQAEVDAFYFTEITGSLIISGSDITNITRLSCLESVQGVHMLNEANLFIVNNPLLTNLDGLQNLTRVTDGLYIQNNEALTNLDGLIKLTSVGQNYGMCGGLFGSSLIITNNDALTNLHGLKNLNFVGDDLSIHDNSSLTSFCGLYTLLCGGELHGDIDISGNAVEITQPEICAEGPCNSIGNTEVYGNTIKWGAQLAMPVTFSESGEITSVSIYHEGGTGNMLLGVYSDQGGFPSSRLGITASTLVSASAGWQTIQLSTPVPVVTGQKVWLSWVFQTAPVIRYTSGTPGRAASTNNGQTKCRQPLAHQPLHLLNIRFTVHTQHRAVRQI
jgi:hypothetical protein